MIKNSKRQQFDIDEFDNVPEEQDFESELHYTHK